MKSVTTLIRTSLTALVLTVSAAPAFAGEIVGYDREKLQAARAAGKTAVVALHAEWCSTCRSQQKALRALLQEPAYRDVTVYAADYDRETDRKKELKAYKQSTLVVFRGQQEVARSSGVTERSELAQLIQKGVAQ